MKNITRRLWLAAAAGGVLAPRLAAAAGAHAGLPAAQSLAQELDDALRGGRVLVALASIDGCPYCRIVRDHYLAPLRAQGQPVVQLELGKALPLTDFAGAPSTHARVVQALRVRSAPTVLFFGKGGLEAAPRLVGLSPDFYGAYLEERLQAAQRNAAA
jgi:hypothetical protein